MRGILRSSGFPQANINRKEDVEEKRRAKAEAIQAEKQKEELLAASEGVKNVASADKDTDGKISSLIEGAFENA